MCADTFLSNSFLKSVFQIKTNIECFFANRFKFNGELIEGPFPPMSNCWWNNFRLENGIKSWYKLVFRKVCWVHFAKTIYIPGNYGARFLLGFRYKLHSKIWRDFEGPRVIHFWTKKIHFVAISPKLPISQKVLNIAKFFWKKTLGDIWSPHV